MTLHFSFDFGVSIALNEQTNRLFIGDPYATTRDDAAHNQFPGAVGVYARNDAGQWSLQQKLWGLPVEGSDFIDLGESLAFTDGQLLVGAPAERGLGA